MSSLSIIIPTLNEATTLQSTLNQLTLLNPPAKEIIVVDGGSLGVDGNYLKKFYQDIR